MSEHTEEDGPTADGREEAEDVVEELKEQEDELEGSDEDTDE